MFFELEMILFLNNCSEQLRRKIRSHSATVDNLIETFAEKDREFNASE